MQFPSTRTAITALATTALLCSTGLLSAEDLPVKTATSASDSEPEAVIRISKKKDNHTNDACADGKCANGKCANGQCNKNGDCKAGGCKQCGDDCKCGNCACNSMCNKLYNWSPYPKMLTVDQMRWKARQAKHWVMEGENTSHKAGWMNMKQWWRHDWELFKARNRQQGRHWGLQIRNKFAYFVPSGCCGEGCPPVGFYEMVYAVNPDYHDPRDGQIYADPATGVPIAVPIAPPVRYQYNYGRGVPSSRLTPLSRVVRPVGR